MMAITHALIGCTGASLIFQTADPLVLGLALLGSQLPDLDSTQSLMGQVCFPIASWIEDRYPHRSITHSFLATAAIAGLSGLVFWGSGRWQFSWALAMPVGHALSIFSDTCTKQGVQLFWPEPVWCVYGSNPRRRLKTGGVGEYWVLAGVCAIAAINFYFLGFGGILQTATDTLGLKDPGVSRTYNENAATNLVYAQVEGFRASDRKPVRGRFLILGEDSGYVVETEDGIYKVGAGLIADRLKTEVDAPARTSLSAIAFDDEEVSSKLQQLRSSNPSARILLSGTLQIDFPDDVVVESEPDKLAVISLSGSNVKLDFCPIEMATEELSNQWAVGSLSVKLIEVL